MAKQDFFLYFLSRFSCKVNSKRQISRQLKGQCQINLTSFDEKTKKIIKLCRHRSQIAFSNTEILRKEKNAVNNQFISNLDLDIFRKHYNIVRQGNWRHVLTHRKIAMIYDWTPRLFCFLIISNIKPDKNKKNSGAE